MVKTPLDAFDLDAKLVDSMFLGRNFFLKICLLARHVFQSSLVLIYKLFLFIELLFESLNLCAQSVISVDSTVDF